MKRSELEKLSHSQLIDKLLKVNKVVSTKKNNNEKIDWSKYCLRHIALRVAYIGMNYHGFTVQKDNDETIEEYILKVMEKTALIKNRDEYKGTICGRTDKGVSGLGQVISGMMRSRLKSGIGIVHNSNNINLDGDDNIDEMINSDNEKEELDYVSILNRELPSDIRIISWAPVPLNFSARFNCEHRIYKYYFFQDNLNIEAMKIGASKLIGTHDYRNFCKMDAVNRSHFTRTIVNFTVDKLYTNDDVNCIGSCDNLYAFTIVGNAFLWHQVRYMTSVLFLIGRELEQPSVIDKLLNINEISSKPYYDMADPYPLVLHDCVFKNIRWIQHSQQSVSTLLSDLVRSWRIHTLQTTILKSFVTRICTYNNDINNNKDELYNSNQTGNDSIKNECKDTKMMKQNNLSTNLFIGNQLNIRTRKRKVSHKSLIERHREPTYNQRVSNFKGKKLKKKQAQLKLMNNKIK